MASSRGHTCNDEISSRFSVVLRPHGRSRRTRSRPVNSIELAFCPPKCHPPGFLEAFRQGLHELGYVEGQTIAFEVRSAEGYSQRLAPLANLLVELKVDVILAVNTPSVQAAKKASATIPIVMTRIADPVKSGLVGSLSKPGGNITGLSFKVCF